MSKVSSIFIVGPTASGKTELAINIAKYFNGEIICADSRTVYRGLNIGTAKPTRQEQAEIKHYGLDLINPNETFSAADFQRSAKVWMKDIKAKNKLPIIVGGSGLYIDSLLFEFDFGAPADSALRQKLENSEISELQQIIITEGIEMPENDKNRRYLIRAIEQGGINRRRGQLMSGAVVIGIDPGQEVLDKRILQRTDKIRQAGVVEEAAWLFESYGYDAPAAAAPFYKALRPHFQSGADLDDCFRQASLNDRRLAKRQRTWFKRNPAIEWHESPAAAERALRVFLG